MWTLAAQTRENHHFTIGAGADIFPSFGQVGGTSRTAGPEAFFEYRYDVARHFDIGANISYKYSGGSVTHVGEGENHEKSLHFNQLNIKFVADWIIFRGRLIAPYIGIGAGGGVMYKNGASYARTDSRYWVAGPRAGIRIWRFQVSANLDHALDHDLLVPESSYGFTVGYTF